MKVNKEKKLVIVLVILLAIAAGYIAFNYLERQKAEELVTAYQSGYEQGLTDAAVSLYDGTEECNTVFVTIGDLTRNLINADCVEE